GSAIFGTLANLVLFPHFGWRTSCMILSGIFLVMTMVGASMMRNPDDRNRRAGEYKTSRIVSTNLHLTPSEVLRTPTFYLLWLGFGLGSTAGLMVISQLIPFAR